MTNDLEISRFIQDDGLWERVTHVENGGLTDVFDLEMEENGNFVCNGFVCHNCSEGLDVPALDVIVLATPLGDPEQAIGRVRRWCTPSPAKCAHYCPWRAGQCQGKPQPVVVDVRDPQVAWSMRKARGRDCFYRRMGVAPGG
jgi:predicted helicase